MKIFRYIIIVIVLIIFLAIISASFRNSLKSFAKEIPFVAELFRKPPPENPIVLKPERSVRLLEGWTNADMASYFEKEGIWSSDEFLFLVGDYSRQKNLKAGLELEDRFDFLKDRPADKGLEGYLYPDTYRIFVDEAKPDELIIRMLENFDKKLTTQMRADIAKQGKTIYEIITMASLVEKEAPINYATGDNKDAKIVAGIFWNRIEYGQALQSCASLAYVLGVNKPQYSTADTQIESPYNTYKYRNLPPGPVSNPGILAIEAAIYPTNTNYNYFLTPAGTKDMIYAATYEQHLINKNKYLP
jgi:UPF0755 protein